MHIIPGLEEYYKGKMLHSHYYRDPEHFKGTKNAIIHGFKSSGSDIALDLLPFCENIYACHNGSTTFLNLPSNLHEKANISHVDENGGFVLVNGEVIEDVELLVICIGYLFDFPFLNENIDFKICDGAMLNLYKHFIHIDYPSLSIVGIPMTVAPFPLMHQQCGYLAKILAGTAKLPSAEAMRQDVENEIERCRTYAKPIRHFHQFGAQQFLYNDMLADLSGLPRNPKIIETLYLHNSRIRRANLVGYKETRFEQINDEEFRVLENTEGLGSGTEE